MPFVRLMLSMKGKACPLQLHTQQMEEPCNLLQAQEAQRRCMTCIPIYPQTLESCRHGRAGHSSSICDPGQFLISV
jgi:hypothetical protein